MCFSAPVSFVASAGLAAVGGAALKKTKRTERFLAAVPLLFAVQQLIEGIQWLAPKPSTFSDMLGYGYLFFAFLVWPIYTPYAAWRLEKNPNRKRLLGYFRWLGIAVATALFVATLTTKALEVHVLEGNLHYVYSFPFYPIIGAFYLLAVCGSLLFSSERGIRLIGLLILLSALAAGLFFWTTFTSVWCFFAAVLSSLIYLYVARRT